MINNRPFIVLAAYHEKITKRNKRAKKIKKQDRDTHIGCARMVKFWNWKSISLQWLRVTETNYQTMVVQEIKKACLMASPDDHLPNNGGPRN